MGVNKNGGAVRRPKNPFDYNEGEYSMHCSCCNCRLVVTPPENLCGNDDAVWDWLDTHHFNCIVCQKSDGLPEVESMEKAMSEEQIRYVIWKIKEYIRFLEHNKKYFTKYPESRYNSQIRVLRDILRDILFAQKKSEKDKVVSRTRIGFLSWG